MGFVPQSGCRFRPHRCAGGVGTVRICGIVARGGAAGRAFTLIDVSVCIGVIAVLLALLAPSLALVREATRRVVCSSNMKQIAYGVVMYSDDHRGHIPNSQFAAKFLADPQDRPQLMMIARIEGAPGRWDGIGHLFDQDYLPAAGVFYCPSHHGSHAQMRYEDRWPSVEWTSLVTNFHYRGAGPVRSNFSTDLNLIAARNSNMSLLTDGLASQSDYSHKVGCNVMRMDTSVTLRVRPGRR